MRNWCDQWECVGEMEGGRRVSGHSLFLWCFHGPLFHLLSLSPCQMWRGSLGNARQKERRMTDSSDRLNASLPSLPLSSLLWAHLFSDYHGHDCKWTNQITTSRSLEWFCILRPFKTSLSQSNWHSLGLVRWTVPIPLYFQSENYICPCLTLHKIHRPSFLSIREILDGLSAVVVRFLK